LETSEAAVKNLEDDFLEPPPIGIDEYSETHFGIAEEHESPINPIIHTEFYIPPVIHPSELSEILTINSELNVLRDDKILGFNYIRSTIQPCIDTAKAIVPVREVLNDALNNMPDLELSASGGLEIQIHKITDRFFDYLRDIKIRKSIPDYVIYSDDNLTSLCGSVNRIKCNMGEEPRFNLMFLHYGTNNIINSNILVGSLSHIHFVFLGPMPEIDPEISIISGKNVVIINQSFIPTDRFTTTNDDLDGFVRDEILYFRIISIFTNNPESHKIFSKSYALYKTESGFCIRRLMMDSFNLIELLSTLKTSARSYGNNIFDSPIFKNADYIKTQCKNSKITNSYGYSFYNTLTLELLDPNRILKKSFSQILNIYDSVEGLYS
jgi:hypothetical protein